MDSRPDDTAGGDEKRGGKPEKQQDYLSLSKGRIRKRRNSSGVQIRV
jgi:hypothetical protein